MVAITILLLVLCQTAVSRAQKCPPWCEALSQCIGSTEPCACCADGDNRNPLATRVIGYAFCRQDKDCSFYGDCCNASAASQPLWAGRRPQWSCKSIGASSDNGGSALMVTTCSAEWADQSVRQKCANATTFPVTSNSSGVTYSNQYCAICNGERPTDLVFWLQYYTCPIANYTNAAVTDLVQLCTFQKFTPPDCPGCVTRPCVISQTIRTCPDGHVRDATAERCESYSCPVVWEDRIYKNLDCALCDGVPASAMEDACAKNYSSKEVELFNAIYFSSRLNHVGLVLASLSLLLDVQNSVYELSGRGSTTTGEASKLCKAGQVFVPKSAPNMDGYCQDQVCLPGEMRVDTECLKMQCNNSNTTFNLTGSSEALHTSTCFENINDACVQLYSNDTRLSTIVQYYGPLDQLKDGYIGTTEDGGLYKFNATLFFCFNFSHTAIPAQELEILGLVILTYVGGAMSIVGCVVLIITYLLFRELRTLPGKLLMNLAVAILASDIALVGLLTIAHYVSSQKYCVSIAIILHFTFLSRFSWMSVIAFRLLLSFSRPFLSSRILKHKGEKKIFMCAFAFGWLSPLLIVVVCIALNFSVDLIGYGKNSRCWITSRGALIGGFIVPVYLSVLFNTACFVVTCWSIFCSTLKHKALTGEGKSRVRVYISLGILMGLTWLFGFIAMSVNSVVTWYLFVALNSTQGLLLSITFLCTKRNANLYSSLCRGKAQRGIRPFITTTSSTQLKAPYTSDSSV